MQPGLLIALPVLLAFSGCSREIQAQDPPTTPPGETGADEATEPPSPEGEVEAPDIELRDPVGLD